MATGDTTRKADELADAVTKAGRRAGAGARRAGAETGARIDRAADAGARNVRRAARQASAAYDETAEDFNDHVGSLEETIRRNPLAAAGAALLVGVVLGRFFL